MNYLSVSCQRVALRGTVVVARPPARSNARPLRAAAIGPRASAFTDVARYLSEAARQIFTPTHDSDVPWERTSAPFTGAIRHHEEVPRLRALLQEIRWPGGVDGEGSCTWGGSAGVPQCCCACRPRYPAPPVTDTPLGSNPLCTAPPHPPLAAR